MKNSSALPSNRFNRLFRLGKMVTGVAGSALYDGVKQVSAGKIPQSTDMLLTPSNAERVKLQLSEMRGAVMKVGQLISMEAGDLLPSEFTEILSGLRESAHGMTDNELENVLVNAWGDNWSEHFQTFDKTPFAAASIGQVHHAVDQQGRQLAIKIQYPGITKSIDSDVDNVYSLLSWFRLLPKELDIKPILEVAKQQLHDEADYKLEARHIKEFQPGIAHSSFFQVPQVIDELTTTNVLCMSYIDGESIEVLAKHESSLKNEIAARLIELSLVEILVWGKVQTDPNYANFRYQHSSNTIGLVDFGALRFHQPDLTLALRELLNAVLNKQLSGVVQAAIKLGYVKAGDPFNYRMAIADLLQTAAEPALREGEYAFGNSSLSQRLSEKLIALRKRKDFQRIPPAEIIFLHRKLAGIYLLCARLDAKVDVHSLIQSVLEGKSKLGSFIPFAATVNLVADSIS